MNMIRNKEVLIYAAAACVITLVSAVLCLIVDVIAGIICFSGCLCITGGCIIFTIRRYHKISELYSYLQNIIRSECGLCVEVKKH